MQTRYFAVVVMCSVFTACVPQAEVVKLQNDMDEVRAEVRNVKTQVPDLSGIQRRQDKLEESLKEGLKGTTDFEQRLADQGARFDQLQTDLQILQGKLEENDFHIKELSQKLDDRSHTIAELSARVAQLETRLTTTATGTSPASEAKALPRTPSPSEAYQQAKSDYDKGNYDLAIAGFENYLKQFPGATFSDSAEYWIGECWYSKKEFDKAIDAFVRVLKDHPKSEKAPGARLKIGYSYLNEKNTVKARESLRKVIKDYPGSKEAELAKEKLKKTGK